MRTAIVYASKHGTTEKMAQMIQKDLGEDKAQLFNLKEERNIDLNQFEQIIIGGSIHAGQIQKRIKDFCEHNTVDLLQKRLGLFLCCMDEKRAEEQFNNAYPETLRSHAISKKVLGGEFLFEKMNFFERAIVKKIAKVNESQHNIDEEKVREFVLEMGDV
jgi:menaquinone-dependent protoporphyrinogen oxidase